MNADTFSKLFYSKKVKVHFDNGHFVSGFVSEIGLAANLNASSSERLPVSLKINNQEIFLTHIEKNRIR